VVELGILAGVRTAALFVVALLFACVPTAAQASVPYWSIRKLLHRIDGARIHVGTRTVRVDKDTALCAGVGRSIRRNGFRMWRRFICTYTTFTRGGVGRDLEFRVRVLGVRRYAISEAHWI
jgi:hypothetical protein